jgi:hypothetical protein
LGLRDPRRFQYRDGPDKRQRAAVRRKVSAGMSKSCKIDRPRAVRVRALPGGKNLGMR